MTHYSSLSLEQNERRSLRARTIGLSVITAPEAFHVVTQLEPIGNQISVKEEVLTETNLKALTTSNPVLTRRNQAQITLSPKGWHLLREVHRKPQHLTSTLV